MIIATLLFGSKARKLLILSPWTRDQQEWIQMINTPEKSQQEAR
jgi:hypothetical protein